MPKERADDLLTVDEVAEILSERAGRPISKDYVRDLRRQKRLREAKKAGNTYLYYRGAVQAIEIRGYKKHGDVANINSHDTRESEGSSEKAA